MREPVFRNKREYNSTTQRKHGKWKYRLETQGEKKLSREKE